MIEEEIKVADNLIHTEEEEEADNDKTTERPEIPLVPQTQVQPIQSLIDPVNQQDFTDDSKWQIKEDSIEVEAEN